MTRDDRGQATVELAFVLPLVGLLLMLVVQVGVVANDQIMVVHAAREGARAAAVGIDPALAVRASGSLEADRIEVIRRGGDSPGERVTVEVRYRSPTALPLIGEMVDDVTLSASATMLIEG